LKQIFWQKKKEAKAKAKAFVNKKPAQGNQLQSALIKQKQQAEKAKKLEADLRAKKQETKAKAKAFINKKAAAQAEKLQLELLEKQKRAEAKALEFVDKKAAKIDQLEEDLLAKKEKAQALHRELLDNYQTKKDEVTRKTLRDLNLELKRQQATIDKKFHDVEQQLKTKINSVEEMTEHYSTQIASFRFLKENKKM